MRGDYPIHTPDDDTLGRAPAAAAFAASILRMDISRGVVLGVLGPWGSGKSSFVNLALVDLRAAGCPVVDFNPWMFSGAEQLVDRFFLEIAAQLRNEPGERLTRAADALGTYGETVESLSWIPVVGSWVSTSGKVSSAIANALERRKGGVTDPREKVSEALSELDRPVVVVLDDIDRLTTPEIREVFKLVRLTASFPNLVYVLAFDRARVEHALTESNVPGRAYLEKILESALDLPQAPEVALQGQLLRDVSDVVESLGEKAGPVDTVSWSDVYPEIVRPLITTMRDVRRYVNAISATLHSLNGQVAVTDVLALEALRVFLPDAYAELSRSVGALTSPSSGLRRDPDEKAKQQIERLLAAEPAHREVVASVVKRLFPSGQQHIGGYGFGSPPPSNSITDRTVAHEPILSYYLERIVGKSLGALQLAEHAATQLDSGEQFTQALQSIPPAAQRDALGYLEGYKRKLSLEQIVVFVTGVLNLIPHMPRERGGMMDLGARFDAGAVAYRVLATVEDQAQTERVVPQILAGVESLSSRMELIDDVGYRENAGHGLVGQEFAAKLERRWRDDVRSASAEQLASEHELLLVLFRAQEDREASEPAMEIPNTPRITLAALQTARAEVVGASAGSRFQRREARLHWKLLQQVFGQTHPLEQRIADLRESSLEIDPDISELATKYLDGWDPDEERRLRRENGSS